MLAGDTAGVWRDGMVTLTYNPTKYEDWLKMAPMRLTTCGQVGRFGPSDAQCRQTYANSDPSGYYQGTTDGIQQLTIPSDGRYRIEAVGARSAMAYLDGSYGYGSGARVWGEFDLKAGTKLSVVVGQRGNYRPNGGGGSQ